MSRNTPTELRTYMKLTEVQLPDGTAQVYLDVADTLVQAYLASSGLVETTLKLIELNLAAHYVFITPNSGMVSQGMLTQIKVGSSEERYSTLTSTRYGIGTSNYGQIAMALDTTGALAALAANPLKAKFEVVGDGSTSEDYGYGASGSTSSTSSEPQLQSYMLLTAEGATGSGIEIAAGTYTWSGWAINEWDGATAQLQLSPDSGTSWIDLAGVFLTSNGGVTGIPLAAGMARVAITNAGASTSLSSALQETA